MKKPPSESLQSGGCAFKMITPNKGHGALRLLYGLICEDAHVRDNGRLDIHGVFHQLLAPGFPALQGRMVLAAAIEWEPEERGEIPFRIDLVEPGGRTVLRIDGQTEVQAEGNTLLAPQTRLILPLENVTFGCEGVFEFVLHVRGRQIRLVPLYLLRKEGSQDRPPGEAAGE